MNGQPLAPSSTELQVRLVSPSIWRPLLDDACRGLTPREQRTAQAVVTTLHDRHIGVTPRLAAELAPLLVDPSKRPTPASAWAVVGERLASELAPPDRAQIGGRMVTRPMSFGLLLGANPLYTVMRLVLPIVDTACRRLGSCYLFCADDVDPLMPVDEYDAYARDLATTIQTLAQSREPQFQPFWQDRALTLSTFTRAGNLALDGKTTTPTLLPDTDPPSVGMLLRLRPDLSSGNSHTPTIRNLAMLHQLRNRQLKQGGIDGIRLTRDAEELDTILLGEFLNPKPILADRIANSGFLAIRREPKPVKLRDVLVAALMPGKVRAQPSADFVKACWFDCAARLSLVLRQNNLHQSEFRWVEGDSFDRERREVFLLREIPQFDETPERGFNANYRRQFLAALRWLPSYLDMRAEFEPLDGFKQTRNGLDGIQTWIEQAWRHQPESVHWQDRAFIDGPSHRNPGGRLGRSEQGVVRLDLRQFAYVHIMVFMPADLWDSPQVTSNLLARLYGGLRLGQHPAAHVSVTWLPDRIEDRTGWRFEARQRIQASLFPGNQLGGLVIERTTSQETPDAALATGMTINRVAAKLEEAWLDQLTKEMWRG